ncbi:MAG: CRISPR-associated endonuclease Cas1, partial [Verrucomicrobiaceae bacterium]
YWPAWARYLPEAFPFGHRSTRPPHNPVNAVLSYLSTLLYGECLASCHRRGLDPAIGFLHPPCNGRWSLPLDLMEPFRAALTEPLTLRLFNHRILRQEHFEPRSGGIYLTSGGRRLLLGHYEKRLTARFLAEHSGTRTSLRDQIDATTLSFKAGLEDARLFVPFTLN